MTATSELRGDELSVVMDLQPGGGFSLDTHAPDGRTSRLAFRYVSIAAPAELVFDEPVTGLRTTVTIQPDGEGTFLTVHQRRLPAELQSERAREGLASILDALAAHLDRIKPDERRTQ